MRGNPYSGQDLENSTEIAEFSGGFLDRARQVLVMAGSIDAEIITMRLSRIGAVALPETGSRTEKRARTLTVCGWPNRDVLSSAASGHDSFAGSEMRQMLSESVLNGIKHAVEYSSPHNLGEKNCVFRGDSATKICSMSSRTGLPVYRRGAFV
jgi:hypothetical protein